MEMHLAFMHWRHIANSSNDPDALDFAQEAFMWLEKHSHDPGA